MDDLELIAAVERRLADVEREKGELELEVIDLITKTDHAAATLPKRKTNMDEAQIRATVADLEFKRTTSSMPLAKEKALLREQEQLKARVKEVKEYQIKEDQLRDLRDRRRVAEDAARSKRDSIRELRLALKKLQLATALGVPSKTLVTTVVAIPDDRVGLVMGKRRAALQAVEAEYGVACEEHIVRDADGTPRGGGASSNDASRIEVTGTREGCMAAKARLERVTLAVELTVKVSAEVAAALRANKWALMHRLEAEHDCRIDLLAPGEVSRGAGGAAATTVTATAAASSNSVAARGRGAAAGSATRVDGGRGERSSKGAAGGSGRGDKGGDTAASVSAASSKPTGPGRVVIRGMPDTAEAASAAIRGLRGARVSIPLNERAVPAILGSKGSNINRIEAEYGVAVDVERGAGTVVVAGEAGAVEAASVELRRLAEDNAPAEELLPLESGFQASLLLRNGGEALKVIQKDLGLLLNV
ncbi:unnamed protein product, partial [Phaeothamnion confervicola]